MSEKNNFEFNKTDQFDCSQVKLAVFLPLRFQSPL